jgi:hypothetical protein
MAGDLPALQKGFASWPATLADAQELAGLLNDYFEVALGLRKTTPEELHRWLTAPGFDLLRSACAPSAR